MPSITLWPNSCTCKRGSRQFRRAVLRTRSSLSENTRSILASHTALSAEFFLSAFLPAGDLSGNLVLLNPGDGGETRTSRFQSLARSIMMLILLRSSLAASSRGCDFPTGSVMAFSFLLPSSLNLNCEYCDIIPLTPS